MLWQMPRAQLPLVLPALFENLDPRLIPTLAELDTATRPQSIQRAVMAIDGLACITGPATFPGDASLQVFHCLWPWVEFLHLHPSYLPGTTDLLKAYLSYSSVLGHLQRHGPTAQMMSKQGGVQAIYTRTWILMLDVPEEQREETCAEGNCKFLLHLNPTHPDNFREMVEEAGGMGSLAAIVVKHLSRSVPRSPPTVFFFSFASNILEHEGPFHSALQSAGIVTALIKALLSLANSISHSLIPGLRTGFLLVIRHELGTAPGYLWMVEALDAGLLHVSPMLLLGALIYPSVIVRSEPWFGYVRELARDPAFRRSSLGPKWRALVLILAERRIFLRAFDSHVHRASKLCDIPRCETSITTEREFMRCSSCQVVYYCSAACQNMHWKAGHRSQCAPLRATRTRVSLKSCDNIECEKEIGPKDEFARCSSCHSVCYCSTACQTMDWRTGGHREICDTHRSTRLREPPLSPRERAFLCALLRYEYSVAKTKILTQQIEYMTLMPGAAFYTQFDYTSDSGNATITVHPIPHSAQNISQDHRHGPQERDLVLLLKDAGLRASRSGGKMEVHLLVVSESLNTRKRMLVMHSPSADVQTAQRRLAAEYLPRESLAREVQTVANLNVLSVY
ncbi:hypothetical protein B0H15DRAFT_996244 [Mycena belliarum]|uniref:MYND-type domain-containing protein n=1 Tax=Mycena belliarum TaxID=1033014 RepID=A0AAD6XQP7_9AGAR|nr:hypothetical protein B0H15DRAFT_996244 [Mycena belliae]